MCGPFHREHTDIVIPMTLPNGFYPPIKLFMKSLYMISLSRWVYYTTKMRFSQNTRFLFAFLYVLPVSFLPEKQGYAFSFICPTPSSSFETVSGSFFSRNPRLYDHVFPGVVPSVCGLQRSSFYVDSLSSVFIPLSVNLLINLPDIEELCHFL